MPFPERWHVHMRRVGMKASAARQIRFGIGRAREVAEAADRADTSAPAYVFFFKQFSSDIEWRAFVHTISKARKERGATA